jgi:hypothetical protein
MDYGTSSPVFPSCLLFDDYLLAESSTLAACSSEMSVNLNQTTQHCTPKDSAFKLMLCF